ncbi:MAG: T9SS type A sorting domain-containing protein [Saprospiraceae bacterium]
MLYRVIFPMLCVFFLTIENAGAQGWARSYTDFHPDGMPTILNTTVNGSGEITALVSNGMPEFYATNPVVVLSLDSQGEIEQYESLTSPFLPSPLAKSMVEVPGGGYLITYEDRSLIDFVGRLIRLDADLHVVWDKQVSSLLTDTSLVLFSLPYNQGYLACGERLGGKEMALVDFDGNVQDWIEPLPNLDLLIRGIPLPNNESLVLGYEGLYTGNLKNHLIRISGNAETVGSLEITDAANGTIYFAYSPNNQIAVLYTDVSNQQVHFKLLDMDLNIVSSTSFPADFAYDNLIAVPGGSGYWLKGIDYNQEANVVMTRLDANGEIQFSRTIRGIASSLRSELTALPDGGCLVGGSTPDDYTHKSFPRLLRLDAQGQDYLQGVKGTAWMDLDLNCAAGADSTQRNWEVRAMNSDGQVWWTTTDTLGHYELPLESGTYEIAIVQSNPAWSLCEDTLVVTIPANDTLADIDFFSQFIPQSIDSICGILFHDYDGDCAKDVFEPIFANWPITINLYSPFQPTQTFTVVTDSEGNFCVPDVSMLDNSYIGYIQTNLLDIPGDGLTCWTNCAAPFTFEESNSAFISLGMFCDSLPPCPGLDVSIGTAQLRTCFFSDYYVNYCNRGAVVAEDAYIEIELDPGLEMISSSIPWTGVSGNTYTFPIGTVDVEACGSFSFEVLSSCDDPTGITYCVEAHAYPDTVCAEGGPNWDGSEIQVTADCEGDSVFFTIQNIGVGNMNGPRSYIVIEDNVLLMVPGSFQLNAGDSVVVGVIASGQFYRMEAQQSPGFPGLNLPVAWVEGCNPNGGTLSLGYVNQYALPDEEPWLDIFCMETVNSFDPNDKTGFPLGYSTEHWIRKNTDIEYMIRFQNTGTAPALYVEIRDTLALQQLDITKVRPGASSHPYTFNIEGDGVLVFRFYDINLPDTSMGQQASQGFVKFRVSQLNDLAEGSMIYNDAAIYFDNNAPIITNQTVHKVGENFIHVQVLDAQLNLSIATSPNPSYGPVKIEVADWNTQETLELRVYSITGGLIWQASSENGRFDLDLSPFSAGVYMFNLIQENQKVAHGKLIKVGK